MVNDGRKTLVGLAALVWAAVVVAVYYLDHKPFTPDEARALSGSALAVAGLIGTVVVAYSLGGWLEPVLPNVAFRERLALRIGAGLGLLGLALLIAGALGGYWSWLAWAVAGLAIVVNGRRCLADLREVLPGWPGHWTERWLAAFVLVALGCAFLNALTPPTAWDALVYHLTGPKLYAEAHRLVHDIDLPYLGFPQWGSMLFTWGLLLAGAAGAQLIHWLFMVLTLMLLPAAVRPVVPGRSWLAAAILAAVPTAILLAGWAYVEWLTMFAGLAAFVCLEYAGSSDRRTGLSALAGAFTALALAAKYNSAGLAVGLGVWALYRLRSPRLIGVYGLGAAAALGPFLLKNLILTGNPVYPFFLPGAYWDSFRAFWYSRPGTGLSWQAILFAPWDMTAWGVEGAELAGKVSYNATIGPLFLTLMPWSVLLWRGADGAVRRRLAGLWVVFGLGYSIWSVQLLFSGLLVQSRLLFPVLPLAVVLAVAGFEGLGRLRTSMLKAQFVMGAGVGLVVVLTGVSYVFGLFQQPVLPVILGLQSPADFRLARLGAYSAAIEGVNALPAGAKVVFLWEPRSYDCAPGVICLPDALLDRWWHLRRLGKSGDAILQDWRSQGVTHVLIYELGRSIIEKAGFDPLTADDWLALRQERAQHLELVTDFFGAYQLYRLK